MEISLQKTVFAEIYAQRISQNVRTVVRKTKWCVFLTCTQKWFAYVLGLLTPCWNVVRIYNSCKKCCADGTFSGNCGPAPGNWWESHCLLALKEWMATGTILYNLPGEVKKLWQKDSQGVLGKKKWGFILGQQSITRLLPKSFHVTVALESTKRVARRKKTINGKSN